MIRILQTNVKNYIWFSRSRTYINKVAHCGFQKAVTVVREGNFMNAVVRCVILGTMTFREPPTWPWAGLKRQPSQGTDVICAEFGRTPVTSPYDVFFSSADQPTDQPTNQPTFEEWKKGWAGRPGSPPHQGWRLQPPWDEEPSDNRPTSKAHPDRPDRSFFFLVFFSRGVLAISAVDVGGGAAEEEAGEPAPSVSRDARPAVRRKPRSRYEAARGEAAAKRSRPRAG